MYSKLLISGEIEVLSGLHIGDGLRLVLRAADAPIVRDVDGHPYLPGSSLKGKLRTLLVRALKSRPLLNPHDADPAEVCRLFGASTASGGQMGRLIVCDAPLLFVADERDGGHTELKAESAIDRASGKVVPRLVERIVPGRRFALRMIYDAVEEGDVGRDLENLAGAMELLTMDYLGGHGTRGSGRIAFRNMTLAEVYGQAFDDEDLRILNGMFADDALNL